MFVLGMFELTLDGKNRLSIPRVIRERMNAEREGRLFYILPGRRAGSLALHPDRLFQERRRARRSSELISDAAYDWRMLEGANCALLDPDDQGRVVIPRYLLDRVGIVGAEVTLVGMEDHLVLWGREAFQAFQEERWSIYPELRAKDVQEQEAPSLGTTAVATSPKD
jgi:DNA-binding transcriptional regulator/RsmH inhibitor MraZ